MEAHHAIDSSPLSLCVGGPCGGNIYPLSEPPIYELGRVYLTRGAVIDEAKSIRYAAHHMLVHGTVVHVFAPVSDSLFAALSMTRCFVCKDCLGLMVGLAAYRELSWPIERCRCRSNNEKSKRRDEADWRGVVSAYESDSHAAWAILQQENEILPDTNNSNASGTKVSNEPRRTPWG